MRFFLLGLLFPSWLRAPHLLSWDGGEVLQPDSRMPLQMHYPCLGLSLPAGLLLVHQFCTLLSFRDPVFHSLSMQAEASPERDRTPWLQGRDGALDALISSCRDSSHCVHMGPEIGWGSPACNGLPVLHEIRVKLKRHRAGTSAGSARG